MQHARVVDRLTAIQTALQPKIARCPTGRITAVSGLTVDVAGLDPWPALGDRLILHDRNQNSIPAEIVSFRGGQALHRSVVVVATSDQPPLLRREAAYVALTIAEHFRDQSRSVLLLMDSVTRFCFALREIGLASGEPPATRGYPPSAFTELPCLLERAGPGLETADGSPAGSITGLFTVLVEGDDHNEPVADAVRGILDGHAVLDRRIAEAGRYPAVDILRSLSRTVPACLTPTEAAAVQDARAILALQAELADMVRLGAYRRGTDPAADRALRLAPAIETLLRQNRAERATLAAAFGQLTQILDADPPAP